MIVMNVFDERCYLIKPINVSLYVQCAVASADYFKPDLPIRNQIDTQYSRDSAIKYTL